MEEATNPGTPEVEVQETATDFADFEKEVTAQPEADAEPDEFEAFDEGNQDEAPEPEAEDDDDDEWQEIEWKGKQIKVPKGAAMMQADYTRKTQELAEQRKAVEATLTQATEVSQAERQLEGQFTALQQTISSYEDIDWQTWVEQDPVAAQKARYELDDLRAQASRIAVQHQQAGRQLRGQVVGHAATPAKADHAEEKEHGDVDVERGQKHQQGGADVGPCQNRQGTFRRDHAAGHQRHADERDRIGALRHDAGRRAVAGGVGHASGDLPQHHEGAGRRCLWHHLPDGELCRRSRAFR